jgi:hypothetical protein
MTAMCDVASLLTFFVMTSTAKIPEALPVDTLLQQFRLLSTDLATLTVGDGKVFFFERRQVKLEH